MNGIVQLDTGTLLCGISVTMLLAAVLLGTFWIRYRGDIHGVGMWTLATAFMGVGSIMFLFQGAWSTMLTVWGANLLVNVGINLVGLGLCRFHNRKVGRIGQTSGGILLATTILLGLGSAYDIPDTGVRIITSTLCIAAAMAFILESLTRETKQSVPGMLLTGASWLVLLLSVVRIGYTTYTFDTLPDSVVVIADPVQGVFILSYFMTGIVVAFALILLVPFRLRERERVLTQRVDMLYREMSHRVGNNLNVVLNYLNMAQEQSTDAQNRAVLAQSQNMVAAISAVHGAMNAQRDSPAGIPLHDHLAGLAQQCVDGFRHQNVRLELDLEEAFTGSRMLKNVILIVNELITNACKYAFQSDVAGTIRVSLFVHEEDGATQASTSSRLCLEVMDDGSGLSEPWGAGAPKGTGFGQALVEHCVDDMDGEIDVETGSHGTRVIICSPYARYASAHAAGTADDAYAPTTA